MDVLEEPDVTQNIAVNLENERRIYWVCIDLCVPVLSKRNFDGGALSAAKLLTIILQKR